MGYLRNEFRLTSNNHYPDKEGLLEKLRHSSGLNLEFNEENQLLSHESLKNSLRIQLCENQQIEIEAATPGYLWWHLTFIFIEMTMDLGGGEGIQCTPSDLTAIVLQADKREQVYKYFWLTSWETLDWAKQPFRIAKNMEGYKEY